ncbi:hypothetical protein BKA70DRAFT_1418533 [Coprinopsis sp. MPI-PUGE-AT-0042]|nr:hypothetical protein BKA70DRAFT_1418533 [Coprinopsis sp. MPI-PUGE-AT-0042]
MNNLLYSHFAMGDENIGASRPGLFDTAPQNRIKTLDSIVSLTISYWSTSSADVRHPNMWWDYDFPNLRTFRLIAFGFEFNEAPEWAGFKLSSFTSKLESMRTLQMLSLCVARLTRDTCKTVFKCFPQLTTLDLGTCDRYWHVLEVLTFIPGRELLPCLKEVAFEVGGDAGYDMVRE